MVKNLFKTALPHLIAIAIFAIVAIIYCKPAIEGKVLQQSDITQWKGMAQNALAYKEINGKWLVYRTSDDKVLKSINYSPADLIWQLKKYI
jgi:hypothetical protein